MRRQLSGLVVLSLVVMGGCIWLDDGDSNNGYYNDEETVVYVNRTAYLVDNYIDGEFAGTVEPFQSLSIYSRNLDGRHEFYSVCRDCSLSWGPTYFTLYEGEVFRIYLEETGMNFSVDR